MDCYLCPELEDCEICPLNAAFNGSPLGKIPSYICEIQKIKIKEKKKFRKEILRPVKEKCAKEKVVKKE